MSAIGAGHQALLILHMQEEDLRKLEEAGCAAVFMPKSLYHTPAAATDANAAMVVGVEGAAGM